MLPLAPNGGVHVAEVSAYPPVSVGVAPEPAIIVPPSCPTHVGCVGMLPGPTEIVYVSVDPVSVPVRNPLRSTMPSGSLTSTGPVTPVPDCVSVHTIWAVTVCTAKSPCQVPVRLSGGGEGVLVP